MRGVHLPSGQGPIKGHQTKLKPHLSPQLPSRGALYQLPRPHQSTPESLCRSLGLESGNQLLICLFLSVPTSCVRLSEKPLVCLSPVISQWVSQDIPSAWTEFCPAGTDLESSGHLSWPIFPSILLLLCAHRPSCAPLPGEAGSIHLS